MANILGIDLDTTELRLTELQAGVGGLSLHAALALPLGTQDAGTLGAQLKTRLKEVGFKATQAVIALGHDAIICREVRHPDIPVEELPAIVQFQVQKESPLPPDSAIVDYVPLKQSLPTGEHRSLTYVARKGRVQFCQKLCEEAGLKLVAVIPKAVAVLAGAQKTLSQAGTEAYAVVCSNTFIVVQQGELIFNRSLGTPNDVADFFAEIKRSLAGYELQPNMPKLAGIFLATPELPPNYEPMLAQLRVAATLYDPYAGIQGGERLAGHGDYGAAAGAAEVTKAFRKSPINFLDPKRVMPKPNRKKTYAIIGGIAAAALIVFGGGLYWILTATTDTEIAGLQAEIKQMQDREKGYGDVEKRFDTINTWANQEVVVLDAIYDLIAAFPDMGGMQIVKVEWKPIAAVNVPAAQQFGAKAAATPSANKAPGIKPIATMTITAVTDQGDPATQFKELEEALREQSHWHLVKKTPDVKEKNKYTFELSVLPAKASEYTSLVIPGKYTTVSGEVQTNTGPRRRPRFTPSGGRQP